MQIFLALLPILILVIGIPLSYLIAEMQWNKFWRGSYFKFERGFWKWLMEN